MSPLIVLFLLNIIAFSCSAEPCVVSDFDDVENATKQCSDIVFDNLYVPAGITLKLNLTKGASVKFKGNTTFGFTNWLGPLVTINGTGLNVQGDEGAIFDGQGQLYWDGLGGPGSEKPQFFTIEAFHSTFSNIKVINTPIDCVQVTNAINVTLSDWIIDDSAGDPGVAPEGQEGINTDGFDVWNSTDVVIKDSVVYNQDDCVAVRCGANVYVANMYCHGTHGLSISVGFSNTSVPLNTLSNVTFADSILVNSDNGIHIKTHRDGGYGSITNVTYRNITISTIHKYGIEIQENYPDINGEPRNNVPIVDLKMVNITGSVEKNAVPVFIRCADGGCADWKWSGVDITGQKSDQCNFNPEGYTC
ncbi:uncharacterized protein LOC132707435 isoform X2 [Cylas formicarius]|uniref:uncharacterized protein LOC132707435 isoform X2 n=1 Tax=Cylas formicarius TaxID=197179 RepID=UPI002958A1DC|nr:uncharacterized protein LOC132707435 isoform X2 [Cylas formicarius]